MTCSFFLFYTCFKNEACKFWLAICCHRASTATPVAPLLPEEALPSSAQAVQWANPAGDGFFRCAQNIITYLQFVCPL